MHVLTILDHPDPASFTAAVAEQFNAGAQAAGHCVELVDLHREGFDPRWTMSDADRENAQDVSPDIAFEQQRIERADAICLVFPLFWWGMPSMTKGWVDRVWSWGWAYDQLDDPEKSLQKPRSGVLLVPSGANFETMEQDGYRKALETSWIDGTFGYFGFSPRKLVFLHGSTGSAERRKALLQQSYDTGFNLAPPSNG